MSTPKRRVELQPLVDALASLAPDERERARRELGAVRALGSNLVELSALCEAQPGAVLWAMMQILVDGRPGFQLLVMDAELGENIAHFNARTLGELALKVAWLVENPGALERVAPKCSACSTPLPEVKPEPGREWLCPKCFSSLTPDERRRGVVKKPTKH